jgi:hypothetical protein
MPDHKKLKGNKRELNGKVEKVDLTAPRSFWIKSEDPELQDKRAKDVRRARYKDAQNAIQREIRAQKEKDALEQKARDDKHELIIAELTKQKK